MRVSELVEASGVPLATIKYYIREGLLRPGASTGARQATYDESHLRRLRLIRALREVAGLPVKAIARIIAIAEDSDGDLYGSLGKALSELPPHEVAGGPREHPRAGAALAQLGQSYDPTYVAVAQLETALAAAESVGMPLTDDRLLAYGRHTMAIAQAEFADMPEHRDAAIEYAVLGTVLYEPALAAFRRLAHHHLALERLRGS